MCIRPILPLPPRDRASNYFPSLLFSALCLNSSTCPPSLPPTPPRCPPSFLCSLGGGGGSGGNSSPAGVNHRGGGASDQGAAGWLTSCQAGWLAGGALKEGRKEGRGSVRSIGVNGDRVGRDCVKRDGRKEGGRESREGGQHLFFQQKARERS